MPRECPLTYSTAGTTRTDQCHVHAPATPPTTVCHALLGVGYPHCPVLTPALTHASLSPVSSKPTFRAVTIGPDQDRDVVEITSNGQELQVQNSSG